MDYYDIERKTRIDEEDDPEQTSDMRELLDKISVMKIFHRFFLKVFQNTLK